MDLALSWAAGYVTSLAWGDIDGDGDLDLAVGMFSNPMISVYLNHNGYLDLDYSWTLDVHGAIRSLAWGDVDGDGDLDLAVALEGALEGAPARVYRNVHGTLDRASPWESGRTDSASAVAWGDVNGDGNLDLAVVSNDGPLRVYINGGDGLDEQSPMVLASTEDATSTAWGDVDGDGDLDLAVGFYGSENKVYFNLDGVLDTVNPWTSGDEDRTQSLAWGDWDGDGDLDLAAGNDDEPIKVYRNIGGALDAIDPWVSNHREGNTPDIAWADADGDGDLDLTAIGYRTSIFWNIDGNLDSTAPWISNDWDQTESAAWGDIDGDGDLDLAVGNMEDATNGIRIYLNRTGTLMATATVSHDVQSLRLTSVAWGDVDGDGDLDLAGGQTEGPVRVFINESGRLSLDNFEELHGSDQASIVAWGDANGDGHLDLAVGGISLPLRIYWNVDGSLITASPWISEQVHQATSLAWGDFDGNGTLELAVGDAGLHTAVYHHSGETFDELLVWPDDEGASARDLAWVDFDSDGDLDLATNGYGPLRIYPNRGGRLDAADPRVFTEVRDFRRQAWGDVDGDGDLDLAAGSDGGLVRVFLNADGDLDVARPWASAGIYNVESVAWGDVDGDGDLDLAVSDMRGTIRVFQNDLGVLDAANPWIPYLGNWDASDLDMAWGDVDGDGDLDLAVADGAQLVFVNQRQGDRPGTGTDFAVQAMSSKTAAADGFAMSVVTGSQFIALPYALSAPGRGTIGAVAASYSPNGGGHWLPAVAAAGTVTRNLATGRWYSFAGNAGTRAILGGADAPLHARVEISEEIAIEDIEVWIAITHTNVAELEIALLSPTGEQVRLVMAGQAIGQDFAGATFADRAVQPLAATAPYTGLYQAVDSFQIFSTTQSAGTWTLVVTDTVAGGGTGELKAWGLRLKESQKQVYLWDIFASGFFGSSDNVTIRLVAYPQVISTTVVPTGTFRYTNSVAGPFQRGYASAVTLPFRVRGTQVRVVASDGLTGTLPVTNALVYRLPSTQSRDALPISAASGQPFRTDNQGYLQGRGRIGLGDTLYALQPLPLPPTYTTYYSNTVRLYAVNTIPGDRQTGVFTVTQAGVQTLTVTATRPLLLFDLIVGLQWDARKDSQYLSKLTYDLKRASELLYIWSRGQVALGNLTLYHDAPNTPPDAAGFQPWDDAHIRIFASNRLRPNSAQGGIIERTMELTVTEQVGAERYEPGQVRIGATWNRYGDPGASLAEDWTRALAHELGHFLLFLDDNYLGVNDDGLLITVREVDCPGVMNNPYNDLQPNFHPAAGWPGSGCATTLSHLETQRADWQTIDTFYPILNPLAEPLANARPGANSLPLAVTQVTFVTATATASPTLDINLFTLTRGEDAAQPGSNARAILYQGDRLIDLGSPTVDQVQAHGARPGDELCVYDPNQDQFGCETVRTGDNELVLRQSRAWQPDIVVTPVTSTTLDILVRDVAQPAEGQGILLARFYPLDAPATGAMTLAWDGDGYQGRMELVEPALGGYIRIWSDSAGHAQTRRDAITDFALGGNPVPKAIKKKPRPVVTRPKRAPVLSPDGSVTLYGLDLAFDEGEFYALQATNVISPPLWATPAGQAYRLIASTGAPPLDAASLSFQYLGEEVPLGEERFLRVYFWEEATQQWLPLETRVDTGYNIASARVVTAATASGLYALMSSLEIPLRPGWNNIAYPAQVSQTVTSALASIAGKYAVVWRYDPPLEAGQPGAWRMHSPDAPAGVNDLHTMEFGAGYWLYVTDQVSSTLYVNSNPPDSMHEGASSARQTETLLAAMSAPSPPGGPPAVFYGTVEEGDGGKVQALVGDKVCGKTTVKDGKFVVKVPMDDGADNKGCGLQGSLVTIVAGQQSATLAWDNSKLWEVVLR